MSGRPQDIHRSVHRKMLGPAHVDGSEGSDNYINPSFLPTLTRDVGQEGRII